jgi:hypothetical protein
VDDAAIREALAAAAAPFATAPPSVTPAVGAASSPDPASPLAAPSSPDATSPPGPASPLVATSAPDATSPPAVALIYAPLFRALAPDVGPEVYPLALEFVYEGYLSHYRVGRLLGPETSVTTRLLAGDHFDASGLRLVARAGDLDAVRLLTRLMASCSWLRAERQPFSYDDDLWALCVAGIASSASGGNAFAALRVFTDVGRLFERGRVERLPEVVRRGAATLWLRHASPLRAALGLAEAPHAPGEPAPDAAPLDAAAVEAAPAVPPAPAPAPDAEVAL